MPQFRGKALINGEAIGPLLFSHVPLSFWGGTDPSTGEIIDRHHPLSGQILRDHILAIPAGRGSCTGSMAMLELMLAGTAPLGLIFEVPEQIITLGVIVAKKMFDRSIPVVVLSTSDFALLGDHEHVSIVGENVHTGPGPLPEQIELQPHKPTVNRLLLTEDEKSLLAKGPKNAKGLAMEILTKFAALQGATSLVSVSQAHIDACVYTGPASLSFAESLLSFPDAKVAVPTSMNSISIDQRRWRESAWNQRKQKRRTDSAVRMSRWELARLSHALLICWIVPRNVASISDGASLTLSSLPTASSEHERRNIRTVLMSALL